MPYPNPQVTACRDWLDDLIYGSESSRLVILNRCRDAVADHKFTLTEFTLAMRDDLTDPDLTESSDPGLDIAAWVMYRRDSADLNPTE